MNILKFYPIIRPHLGLVFSWRFGVLAALVGVSALCVFVGHSVLDVSVSALPIYVYVIALLVIALAAFCAFAKLPVERTILKRINHAMSDLRYEEVERLLAVGDHAKLLFILPTSKIHFLRLKASFYKHQGRDVEAYKIIKSLQELPLLSWEEESIEIVLMGLYFSVGNLKACQHLVAKLTEKNLKSNQKLKYSLMQCELQMYEGNFQTAKNDLEILYGKLKESSPYKVAILHTNAVIETHLGNYQAVLTAYRQAWEIQKRLKHSFAQAERTAENLIQTYAKQGEFKKIYTIFKELESLASKDSPTQILALNNIKISLARQLNDRQMLLRIYAEAEQNLLPQLKGEQKFMYIVTSLRMHFNDGVDFEKVLQTIQSAMLDRPAISTLNTLRVIKEISGILQQTIEKLGPRQDLMIFYRQLLSEFRRLESELDRLQDEVPLDLPGPKAELISFKIENLKNSLALMSVVPSRDLFKKMFELLEEKKNLWQGMNNPLEQLNVLIIILDDYQAYKRAIKDVQFEIDFRPLALKALDEAEVIMNNNLTNLFYSDKLIGLAYMCCQLNIKKDQAKLWLESFENNKLSLNHYALWLRAQYSEAKEWVSKG